MQLRTGAIYSLYYLRWKTNFKIYAFILWPGGGTTKVHLLNLAAKQLNIMERARIVRTIARLMKIPNATKYNGKLLYKIFKTYLPIEIQKCYRTFFPQYIHSAALINYGLNDPSKFTEMELSGQAKSLYDQALRDFQVKALNWYTKRGYDMEQVKKMMASAQKPSAITSGRSTTQSAMHPAIKIMVRKPTGLQYQKAWEKIRKPIGTDTGVRDVFNKLTTTGSGGKKPTGSATALFKTGKVGKNAPINSDDTFGY